VFVAIIPYQSKQLQKQQNTLVAQPSTKCLFFAPNPPSRTSLSHNNPRTPTNSAKFQRQTKQTKQSLSRFPTSEALRSFAPRQKKKGLLSSIYSVTLLSTRNQFLIYRSETRSNQKFKQASKSGMCKAKYLKQQASSPFPFSSFFFFVFCLNCLVLKLYAAVCTTRGREGGEGVWIFYLFFGKTETITIWKDIQNTERKQCW
jgi:hypothetical protein